MYAMTKEQQLAHDLSLAEAACSEKNRTIEVLEKTVADLEEQVYQGKLTIDDLNITLDGIRSRYHSLGELL